MGINKTSLVQIERERGRCPGKLSLRFGQAVRKARERKRSSKRKRMEKKKEEEEVHKWSGAPKSPSSSQCHQGCWQDLRQKWQPATMAQRWLLNLGDNLGPESPGLSSVRDCVDRALEGSL